MSTKASFQVKIAAEDWEFEQIHRLNHRTFAEEIRQHPEAPSQRLVDKFHEENVYVIGLRGRRLSGMVAIRTDRPFSLDQRLPELDSYLPSGRAMCELRLLAVEKHVRTGRLLPALLDYVWRYCLRQGYDLALISGITRQLSLYRHLGFVPFGPLVGSPDAQFQPMMLTIERFAPRAATLFRDAEPTSPVVAGNFLPGPVALHEAVTQALQRPAESHRSAGFSGALEATKTLLRQLVGASRVEVLVGSGTAANDMIAGQLSLEGGRGLVLSNGEFGERLEDHARRFGLAFDVVSRPWGCAFDVADIERRLEALPALRWIWLVHCETSTGVLNDLEMLRGLCSAKRIALCVDTISSIGTVPLSLEGIRFASGVSGKGLGAFPGLAMVFYDHDLAPAPNRLPRYLDLGVYASSQGVPFTHSSNLVGALHTALGRTTWHEHFRELAEASAWVRCRLRRFGFDIVASDAHAAPGVVTIALPATTRSLAVGQELEQRGYLVSVNSRYLIERNWIQICLMGELSREGLAAVSTALYQVCGDRSATAAGVRR